MKIFRSIINWFQRLFAGVARGGPTGAISHADWLNITASQTKRDRKNAKRLDDAACGGWMASHRVWAKWDSSPLNN